MLNVIIKCFQEAAQRYTDTSWRIFRQSQKNCLIVNPPPANEVEPHKRSLYDISPSSSENSTLESKSIESTEKENDGDSEPHQNKTEETPKNRKVVEIETVEVVYEPVDKKVEVKSVRIVWSFDCTNPI